jgi:hypothetical protein
MSQNLKKWDENTIRSYLQEEFPQAGVELVTKVTAAIMAEGQDRIENVLGTYRSGKQFGSQSRFGEFNHTNSLQVGAMLEGVHRRFIGGTYNRER